MDLQDYVEMKAKGLAGMAKIGNSYVLSMQRYTPRGDLAEPEVQAIGRETIESIRAKLNAQLSAVDSVASEMDALDG